VIVTGIFFYSSTTFHIKLYLCLWLMKKTAFFLSIEQLCSSGWAMVTYFKLKKMTINLTANLISCDVCVDHHRPPLPSNWWYRRLHWPIYKNSALGWGQWATASLKLQHQVGMFDSRVFFTFIAKTLISDHHGQDPFNTQHPIVISQLQIFPVR
jgi:hypothetical protein